MGDDRRRAVVVPVVPALALHEPGGVHRVVRHLVLHVEERTVLRQIKRREEVRRRIRLARLQPVAQDKRVALHGLCENDPELLLEELLPLRRDIRLVHVVIAGDEEPLDPHPVAPAVVGEHLEPGLRHQRKLTQAGEDRQIPGNQHRIDFSQVEVTERALEVLGRTRTVDMDIRKDADAEVRRPRAQRLRCGKRRTARKKTAPRQVH